MAGPNNRIVGAVDNAGTIAVGSLLAPHTLDIVGTLALQGTSTVDIDVNGLAVGTGYDQLRVTGAVTLAGTLNVVRDPAFVPALLATFDIITHGSSSGLFALQNGVFDPFPVSNPDRQFFSSQLATTYQLDVQSFP